MKRCKNLLLSLLSLPLCLALAACAPQANEVEVIFPACESQSPTAAGDTAPFRVCMTLPEGWEVRAQPEASENFLLATPVELLCGGEVVATMGYGTYEEVPDVPAGQYYQVVYSGIRLGSIHFWDTEPYEPVKVTESGETSLATVAYKDPAEMEANPGAMAAVPYIEVPGILSYDRERGVYVGIQFAEGAAGEEQLRAIAESIVFAEK